METAGHVKKTHERGTLSGQKNNRALLQFSTQCQLKY